MGAAAIIGGRYDRTHRWTTFCLAWLAVAGAYGWLQTHHTSQNTDANILYFISAAFASVAIVLLVGFWLVEDRRVDARATGLFLAILGDAILYFRFGLSIKQQTQNPEWIINIPRALFLVGATLALWGCVVWTRWVFIRIWRGMRSRMILRRERREFSRVVGGSIDGETG